MEDEEKLSLQIIEFIRSFEGFCAGIAAFEQVLFGRSYDAISEDAGDIRELYNDTNGSTRSVVVLGYHHPEKEPEMDWWKNGNTAGNRKLMDVSSQVIHLLEMKYRRQASALPYHLERGGVFLKDAAVFAGLGVIGKNNLIIHPKWGPRIRLRAILVEGDLQPTGQLELFSPCVNCEKYCQTACPVDAFIDDVYHFSRCNRQMQNDIFNKTLDDTPDAEGFRHFITKYCRACELACPIGDIKSLFI